MINVHCVGSDLLAIKFPLPLFDMLSRSLSEKLAGEQESHVSLCHVIDSAVLPNSILLFLVFALILHTRKETFMELYF